MFYERDYGHELFIFNVTLDRFMYLVFDTETTGLPRNWSAPLSDSENWPHCVQIAWQLHASDGTLLSHENYLVKPIGFDIPFESEKVHGISTALASKDGLEIESVIESFLVAIDQASYLVGHNLKFDLNIMGAELLRLGRDNILVDRAVLDTCTENTATLCELPGGRGGKFKLPTHSVNCIHFCTRILLPKHTTQQQMSKQPHGYFWN